MNIIIILYNVTKSLLDAEPQDLLSLDSLQDVVDIQKALQSFNISCRRFEVNESSIDKLKSFSETLFFNQCYGIGSLPHTDYEVPKLLAKWGKPFTGSDARTLKLTTDKKKTKLLFKKFKIPTPGFKTINSLKDIKLKPFSFKKPWILKPVREDSSSGISQKSVVTNLRNLKRQAEYLLSVYHQPVLCEEYIDGRELNVTMVGNGKGVVVLPITELCFHRSYSKKNRWKLNDFTAKWYENSEQYDGIDRYLAEDLDEKLRLQIIKLCQKALRITGCLDYVRMDIRLSPEKIPYFLEVNANPAIGRKDGTTIGCLKYSKMSYEGFIKKIVEAAVLRYSLSPLARQAV